MSNWGTPQTKMTSGFSLVSLKLTKKDTLKKTSPDSETAKPTAYSKSSVGIVEIHNMSLPF